MLQSVWSRLRRRRSILPARDMFDADLDRARGKPGCVLCRLVQEHDQQVMHSFLWEYCTDPHVGVEISRCWGFCPYHTWSLAILEHERLGDGLGITIVFQALLRQLLRFLTSQPGAKSRNLPLMFPIGPEIGDADCRFCHSVQQEESQFLARLAKRFQQVVSSSNEEDWSSLQTELCLPHIRHLLAVCPEGSADRPSLWRALLCDKQRVSLTASQQRSLHTLAALLLQFTAQRVIESDTGSKGVHNDWGQITHYLDALVGNREALPVHVTFKAIQSMSRQLLLITGERSKLESPARTTCPVCVAATSACVAECLKVFESEAPLPSTRAFCQSHHWILAASMFLQEPTDTMDRYRSWLKQQLEQQVTVLATSQEYRTNCLACSRAAKASEENIASITQGLRQTTDDSATLESALLCLPHWKQFHESCMHERDATTLQKRLLHRQQLHLAQLDITVEAYLARFNAAKRERNEVPDIPGAAWAWVRLLAFFAGEPALILPVGM